VPPIQAAPTITSIPDARIPSGITTIITTVKIRDIPTASVSSSFFTRAAAATAIAAETPQTDVAAAITITSPRLGIRSQRVPKAYIVNKTTGVTIQATNRPGTPRSRMLLKRISAPSKTSPVLMYSSPRNAGFNHTGVPILLAASRPSPSAQNA
jgi:hypothetical protein